MLASPLISLSSYTGENPSKPWLQKCLSPGLACFLSFHPSLCLTLFCHLYSLWSRGRSLLKDFYASHRERCLWSAGVQTPGHAVFWWACVILYFFYLTSVHALPKDELYLRLWPGENSLQHLPTPYKTLLQKLMTVVHHNQVFPWL